MTTEHFELKGVIDTLAARTFEPILRQVFKRLVGPPQTVRAQRLVVKALAKSMPGCFGVKYAEIVTNQVVTEKISPTSVPVGRQESPGVILYLHGGAFCLGAPGTHRSITSRLAKLTGMTVWVPDYRLAPEHPYPAAPEDCRAVYNAIIQSGVPASNIVIAGDSAGSALALALAHQLRDEGREMPAALLLLSPFTDLTLGRTSIRDRADRDPMLSLGWLSGSMQAYACPVGRSLHAPSQPMKNLPPMLIQVGTEEVLFDDAMSTYEMAQTAGTPARLEVYKGLWHVFQLQAGMLPAASRAIEQLAAFAIGAVSAKA